MDGVVYADGITHVSTVVNDDSVVHAIVVVHTDGICSWHGELVKVWGCSQFTFTPFSRFLTTHLPLVYNHLHCTDHLPICKYLHGITVDHPLSISASFLSCSLRYAEPSEWFSNDRCKIQNCHFWFKVRDDLKRENRYEKKVSNVQKRKKSRRLLKEHFWTRLKTLQSQDDE